MWHRLVARVSRTYAQPLRFAIITTLYLYAAPNEEHRPRRNVSKWSQREFSRQNHNPIIVEMPFGTRRTSRKLCRTQKMHENRGSAHILTHLSRMKMKKWVFLLIKSEINTSGCAPHSAARERSFFFLSSILGNCSRRQSTL